MLDVACGVGYGSHLLATRGAASVHGVDLSREAIDYALSHYKAANLTFAVGDCRELASVNTEFDVAVSFETIEHPPNPPELVDAVSRVLRPGGLFICSSPNIHRHSLAAQPVANPYHPSEMDFETLHAAISRRFCVTASYQQSESPEYCRAVAAAQAVGSIVGILKSSRLLRAECALRRMLGKPSLSTCDLQALSESVARTTQHDWAIEPLTEPSPHHLVFIVLAHRR